MTEKRTTRAKTTKNEAEAEHAKPDHGAAQGRTTAQPDLARESRNKAFADSLGDRFHFTVVRF